MPAAWHGGPGELVASEAFPGLGVAWVTSAVPRALAALMLDFSRVCLTMVLTQTRLDGEEQS